MTAVFPCYRPCALPTSTLGASLGALYLPLRNSALHSHAARWPEVLSAPQTTSSGPGRRLLSLRAGMAELVRPNQLLARTRRELTLVTLERAARIIELKARNWLRDEL
jgi:hypothetical protein